MITKEQREINKAVNLYYDTVADFEWEREQFNKRMIELYPSSYIANYWLLVKDYINKYLLGGGTK
jgi:hypothetical protein